MKNRWLFTNIQLLIGCQPSIRYASFFLTYLNINLLIKLANINSIVIIMGSSCLNQKCFDSSYMIKADFIKSQYKFQKVIGKGAFGKVWKAHHKKSKRIVAVKIMKKVDVVSEKMIGYIVKEQAILEKLQHPFIVNMSHSFQDRRHLFLILDYMPYRDLRNLFQKRQLISQENIKFFTICILHGLDFLHSNNIIHRDIKPQNIMIDEQGYLRIGDMGMAIELNYKLTESAGTICYISPQAYFKQYLGPVVDYFSLGVVIYQAFTRQRPYINRNRNYIAKMQQNNQSIKIPEKHKKNMSQECQIFITSLLQINYQKRLGFKGIDQFWNHQWLRSHKSDIKQILNKSFHNNLIKMDAENIGNPQACIGIQKQNIELDSSLNIHNMALQRDLRFQSLFKEYRHFIRKL